MTRATSRRRASTLATCYREMLRIRRFEERCVELYSAAKIRGFLHLYIGEEAVAVGVMQALAPDDAVVATYREHGHALARGVAGRRDHGRDVRQGRGLQPRSRRLDAPLRRRRAASTAATPSSAAACRSRSASRSPTSCSGRDAVTACFFGEGAVAEGEFHECVNLAALWHLPVLFCCENNLYAMGTALARSESETDLALKAASYEMPAWSVDGMDVLAVERGGPARRRRRSAPAAGRTSSSCRTYRFRAHSMYDPELYRDEGRGRASGRSATRSRCSSARCARPACSTTPSARDSRPRSRPRSTPRSPSPRPGTASRSRTSPGSSTARSAP